MPRGRKFVAALSALSMAAVLSAIDQTVVSTALPHIIDSLQGAQLLGWVFTAYFLGATATVAVVGKLADLFGRRRVFILSIALFCVGSLLCGLANSMPLLVVFRGMQGIGAGGIQTCSLIVMGDMFSPRERGQVAGHQQHRLRHGQRDRPVDRRLAVRQLLVALDLSAERAGVSGHGRRAAVRPARGSATGRPARTIDWAGGTWSVVAVVTLLLALTWAARDYAWISPRSWRWLAWRRSASVLLFRAERRAPEPVIPGNLLRGNIRALSCVAAFGNSLVWFGLILLVPVRLQLVLGTSATLAGALLTPGIVMGPIGSVLRRPDHEPHRTLPRAEPDRRRAAGRRAVAMLLFSPPTSGVELGDRCRSWSRRWAPGSAGRRS